MTKSSYTICLLIAAFGFGTFLGYRVCKQINVSYVSADTSSILKLAQDIRLGLERLDAANKPAPSEIAEISDATRDNPWLKVNKDRVLYFKCAEVVVVRIVTKDGRVVSVNKGRSARLSGDY